MAKVATQFCIFQFKSFMANNLALAFGIGLADILLQHELQLIWLS
jgi:hypothetical protein